MINGIVSGCIYKDEEATYHMGKDIDIHRFVNNDEWEAFADIDSALIEAIDIGECKEYHFIALVEAEFTTDETPDGTEYDVEYQVTEIKSLSDLK